MIDDTLDLPAAATKETTLYRHFDCDGKLLYVGISLDALNRLAQHKFCSTWYSQIKSVTLERFPSRQGALQAEREAIIKEGPQWNIKHRKSAQEAMREAEKERLSRDRFGSIKTANGTLVQDVVQLRPLYTLRDAAASLGVNTRVIKQWIADESLGFVEINNMVGKPIPHVTGWQLLDKLESMCAARKRKGAA
jgi:hypothetical protein